MGILINTVFGLIFGSFLNVVRLRFTDWRSIVTGRSECPDCHEQLRWYDLIPVVSYATLRGRCRYCQKTISWQYPATEIGTALLLALGYWLVFSNATISLGWQVTSFIALIVAIGALVITFFDDLNSSMITDFFSYVLLVAALVFSFAYYQQPLDSLYGFLIGIVPIALLVYPSHGRWMGEGDVKLAAGLGLLVAYPNAIVLLIAAFVFGALYGLVLMATGRAKLGSAVPFGPFLILGGMLALFWGSHIIEWYLGQGRLF